MADIYMRKDAINLLRNKRVLLIGDSNIRALYKDLIWLLKTNSLIGLSFLKRRLEGSFLGDKLLSRSELTRGRDFTEHRIFESNGTIIEFLFVTRCYCNSLVKVIKEIENGTKHCPDVILMNSCLWDVSRWGPNGVYEYKANMEKLMKFFSTSLPKHVLFIWATALPIAALTSGGLIIKQIEFLQAMLRIHVIEANGFSAALVSSYGFDVLDFHHYMRYQIIRRSADGIHFLPTAMRFLTNLLLTHIALSWDVKLPGNSNNFNSCLAGKILKAIDASSANEVKQMFEKIELLANTLNKQNAGTPVTSKKKKQVKNVPNIDPVINEKKSSEKVEVKSAVRRILIRTPPNYKKAIVCNRREPIHQSTYTFQSYHNHQSWNKFASNSNNFQDHNNLQINRPQNANDFNNIQFHVKNFRLLGFDDFNQTSSSHKSLDVYNVRPTYWLPDDVSSNDYGSYDSDYRGPDNYYKGSNPAQNKGYRGQNDYYNPSNVAQNHIFKISRTVVNDPPVTFENPNNENSRYNNNHDRFSYYHNHPYKSSQGGWPAWDEAEDYHCDPGPVRQRRNRYNQRTRYTCGREQWY